MSDLVDENGIECIGWIIEGMPDGGTLVNGWHFAPWFPRWDHERMKKLYPSHVVSWKQWQKMPESLKGLCACGEYAEES